MPPLCRLRAEQSLPWVVRRAFNRRVDERIFVFPAAVQNSFSKSMTANGSVDHDSGMHIVIVGMLSAHHVSAMEMNRHVAEARLFVSTGEGSCAV